MDIRRILMSVALAPVLPATMITPKGSIGQPRVGPSDAVTSAASSGNIPQEDLDRAERLRKQRADQFERVMKEARERREEETRERQESIESSGPETTDSDDAGAVNRFRDAQKRLAANPGSGAAQQALDRAESNLRRSRVLGAQQRHRDTEMRNLLQERADQGYYLNPHQEADLGRLNAKLNPAGVSDSASDAAIGQPVQPTPDRDPVTFQAPDVNVANFHQFNDAVRSQQTAITASFAQLEQDRASLDQGDTAAIAAFNTRVNELNTAADRIDALADVADNFRTENKDAIFEHQVSNADRSGFASQYEFIDHSNTAPDLDDAGAVRNARFDLTRAGRVLTARVSALQTRIDAFNALPNDQKDPAVARTLSQEAAQLTAEANFQNTLGAHLQSGGGGVLDQENPYAKYGAAVRRHNLANPDNPINAQGIIAEDSTPEGERRVTYTPEFAAQFGEIVGERVSGDPVADRARLEAALDAQSDAIENENPGTGRFAGSITQDEQGKITFSETPTARLTGQPTDTEEFDPGTLGEEAVRQRTLREIDEARFARDPEGGSPGIVSAEADLYQQQGRVLERIKEIDEARFARDPEAGRPGIVSAEADLYQQQAKYAEQLDREEGQAILERQAIDPNIDQRPLPTSVTTLDGAGNVITFDPARPFDSETRTSFVEAMHAADSRGDEAAKKDLERYYEAATGNPITADTQSYFDRKPGVVDELKTAGLIAAAPYLASLAIPSVVGTTYLPGSALVSQATYLSGSGLLNALYGSAIGSAIGAGFAARAPDEVEGWREDLKQAGEGAVSGAIFGFGAARGGLGGITAAGSIPQLARSLVQPGLKGFSARAAAALAGGAVFDTGVALYPDPRRGGSIGFSRGDLLDIGLGAALSPLGDAAGAGFSRAAGPVGAVINKRIYGPSALGQRPVRFPAETFATSTKPREQRVAEAQAYVTEWLTDLRTSNPAHYAAVLETTGGRAPTLDELRLTSAIDNNVDVAELLRARETLSRGGLTPEGGRYDIPDSDLQLEFRPSPFQRQRPEGTALHATQDVTPLSGAGLVTALPGKGAANLGVFYSPGAGLTDPLRGAYDPRFRRSGEGLRPGIIERDLSEGIVTPKISLQPTPGQVDLNTVVDLPRQGNTLAASAEPPPGKRHRATLVAKDGQGRILLVKGKGDALWGLPGGGVDPGETAVTAGARELREETGYAATDVTGTFDYNAPTTYHSVFEATVPDSAAAAQLQAKEIEEVRWWNGEALDLLPSTRDILETATGSRPDQRPARANEVIRWGQTQDWRQRVNPTAELEVIDPIGTSRQALDPSRSVRIQGQGDARYYVESGAPDVTRGQIARGIVEHVGERLRLLPESGFQIRNTRTGELQNADAWLASQRTDLEARAESGDVEARDTVRQLDEIRGLGDAGLLARIEARAEAGDPRAQQLVAALRGGGRGILEDRDEGSLEGRLGQDGRAEGPTVRGEQRTPFDEGQVDGARADIDTPAGEPARVELDPSTGQSVRTELAPPTAQQARVELDPTTGEPLRTELDPPTTEPQRFELDPPYVPPGRVEIEPPPYVPPGRVEIEPPTRELERTGQAPEEKLEDEEDKRRRRRRRRPDEKKEEARQATQGQVSDPTYARIASHEETILDVQRPDGSADRILVDVDQPAVTLQDGDPPPARVHLVGNQTVQPSADGQDVEGQLLDPLPTVAAATAADENPGGQVETVRHSVDLDTGERIVERYREPRREGETLEEQLQRAADNPVAEAGVAAATVPPEQADNPVAEAGVAAATVPATGGQSNPMVNSRGLDAYQVVLEARAKKGDLAARLDLARSFKGLPPKYTVKEPVKGRTSTSKSSRSGTSKDKPKSYYQPMPMPRTSDKKFGGGGKKKKEDPRDKVPRYGDAVAYFEDEQRPSINPRRNEGK